MTIPVEEIHAYLLRLRPYLKTSLILFGAGFGLGLIIVNRFPEMADGFEGSLIAFIKVFRGFPKLQLAAAIFLNNTVKTLAAILLGVLFGVLPAFFLVVNGAALGLVLSLSMKSRGLWASLISILPHGVLELPAVFLGTSIGIMMGVLLARKLFAKSDAKIGVELGRAMKFYCLVIVPLLFFAAVVEAYVTSALVPR